MLRRNFASAGAAKRAIGAVLLWLSLTGVGVHAAAMEQTPAALVGELQQKLVAVWRSDAGFDERFEALAPPIEASHDLASMARFALGNRWRELSGPQRERFLAAFRRLTIATYADRFDEYGGERFIHSGQRRLSPNKYLVQTRLVLRDGSRIRLDYLLHLENGQWQIVNVLADGVSELAIKRSEYTAFIRDHGFAALVEELQRKVSRMAGEQQSAPPRSVGGAAIPERAVRAQARYPGEAHSTASRRYASIASRCKPA